MNATLTPPPRAVGAETIELQGLQKAFRGAGGPVQAARWIVGGRAWGVMGWAVVAVWTVVCTGLARYAYRRDTARV